MRKHRAKHKKKAGRIALIAAVSFLLICSFLYYQNNKIDITQTTYVNSSIPDAFNGYKIVQLSDLHNKSFGRKQKILYEKIMNLSPDILVTTGDMVQKNKAVYEHAIHLFDRLVTIAPTYFVTGNEERRVGRYYDYFAPSLKAMGVHILSDCAVDLSKDGDTISLIGVDDFNFIADETLDYDTWDSVYTEKIQTLSQSRKDSFKILLAHRPEKMDIYAQCGIDLVLAGHAHGGQIILPGVGGLYAPNQGKLPVYYRGTYVNGNTTMLVNRGLGNSIAFPFRIFNHPEITVITLSNKG